MNQTTIEFLNIFRPILEVIIAVLAPVILTFLSGAIIKTLKIQDEKQKLQIEQQLRNALHASASNAVVFAAQKWGYNLKQIASDQAIQNKVLSEAMNYVVDKNPDTMRKLGVTGEALKDILLSKLPL